MLTTEDEAKTKWCPEVRTGVLAGSGAVAVNRSLIEVVEETRCVGSACMAWRKVGPTIERTETGLGQIPDGEGWRQVDRGRSHGLVWERNGQPARGYCGKAGKP